MKLFLAFTLLTAAAVLCVAGVAPGVTYVDHEKVSAAFRQRRTPGQGTRPVGLGQPSRQSRPGGNS